MSVMRALRVPSIASAGLLAILTVVVATPALAQSGGGSSGGSSSGGSSGGASSGSGTAGSAAGGGAVSRPSYSPSPPPGTEASGGRVGAADGSGRAAGAGDIPRAPETAGRTIRCPDGTIGKTNAGGCLGDPICR